MYGLYGSAWHIYPHTARPRHRGAKAPRAVSNLATESTEEGFADLLQVRGYTTATMTPLSTRCTRSSRSSTSWDEKLKAGAGVGNSDGEG